MTDVAPILRAMNDFERVNFQKPTRLLIHPEHLFSICTDAERYVCFDVTGRKVCGLIAVQDATLAIGEVLVA